MLTDYILQTALQCSPDKTGQKEDRVSLCVVVTFLFPCSSDLLNNYHLRSSLFTFIFFLCFKEIQYSIISHVDKITINPYLLIFFHINKIPIYISVTSVFIFPYVLVVHSINKLLFNIGIWHLPILFLKRNCPLTFHINMDLFYP